MEMELNALPDDFRLNAISDTERSEGAYFAFDYYLTDTEGNHLTDTAGNRLIARYRDFLYPQVLNALPDDFRLNAE